MSPLAVEITSLGLRNEIILQENLGTSVFGTPPKLTETQSSLSIYEDWFQDPQGDSGLRMLKSLV